MAPRLGKPSTDSHWIIWFGTNFRMRESQLNSKLPVANFQRDNSGLSSSTFTESIHFIHRGICSKSDQRLHTKSMGTSTSTCTLCSSQLDMGNGEWGNGGMGNGGMGNSL